eukprot:SAG31_NODE_828_length_11716_cov_4.405785_2_plen_515_part_00
MTASKPPHLARPAVMAARRGGTAASRSLAVRVFLAAAARRIAVAPAAHAARVVLVPGGGWMGSDVQGGGAPAGIGDLVAANLADPSAWEFWPCEPLPPPDVLGRVEAVINSVGGGGCGTAELLGAVAGAVGDRTAVGGGPVLYQDMRTGIQPAEVAAVPAQFAVANVHPSSVSLAEFVLAAMLQSTTSLPSLDQRFRACTWRARPPGNTPAGCPSMREEHGALYGTSMCILGFGHLGAEVAKRAAAFGVAVSGTTIDPPNLPPSPLLRLTGPSREEAEACVADTDFVVVALPLNGATAGLMDSRMLRRMGPNAMLINPARGGIVVESDLFTALRDGVIRAAALDVWWQGIDADRPGMAWLVPNATGPAAWPSRFRFDQLPGVIMTPHVASRADVETAARFAELAQQLDRLARSEPPANILRSGRVPFPDIVQAHLTSTPILSAEKKPCGEEGWAAASRDGVAPMLVVVVTLTSLAALMLGYCLGKYFERRAWKKMCLVKADEAGEYAALVHESE